MASAATHAVTWRAATTPAQTVEWGTPPALYESLDREFDFTIDAASSPINAKHIRSLSRANDALRLSFADERVFCNPPYGRELGEWVQFAFQSAVEENALWVMVLPARTDTRWFHEIILPHAEIRFIRGRLSYVRDQLVTRSGRCPFPSMVNVFRPGLSFAGQNRQQQLFPFLPKELAR